MGLSRARRWLACSWLAGLLLIGASEPAAAQPRRVLLLHSFGPHFAPWNAIVGRLREELVKQSPYPIDLYEASLQSERFGQPQEHGPFVHYLRTLFAPQGLDLVISLGAPAARFFQQNRSQIFPTTPLVIAAADVRTFSEAALTAHDTTVPVTFDLPEQIGSILQVLPHTTTIAVVIGDSPLEKFWVQELRRAVEPFTQRVTFDWFNTLPVEDMVTRVRELPPRSAIYYATVRVDARGVPHEDDRVLARLRAVAAAPIFTYMDTHFGNGTVGGPMFSGDQIARETTRVAIRILGGEEPRSIKTPPVRTSVPAYDWRELQRWGIAESDLPPGSTVQFRQPTTWERYRVQIVVGFALLLAQAGLIQWLLYERWKRRRSDGAAHELSARLVHAQEEDRSRLARELHDDVTQRLAALAIDAGREERKLPAERGGAAMQSMREGLVRLSEDVHALSYRLHPSILEDLGLVEALRSECDRFARIYPLRLEVNAFDVPGDVPRAAALCLFRIAQEALNNIARHAAAHQVTLALRRRRHGLELAISDDGVGFDTAHHRPSLGHASMRQRAFLLGGSVEITSSPGRGTTIVAWVPLREESSSAN